MITLVTSIRRNLGVVWTDSTRGACPRDEASTRKEEEVSGAEGVVGREGGWALSFPSLVLRW